ncbi:hypothetical protein ACNOYE_04410 [Nannocystaceae bacterium ST9]
MSHATTTITQSTHPNDDIPTPTFFILASPDRPLPPRPELDRQLARWLLRELSGWVQLVILEMLADGRLEIVEDALVRPRVDPRQSDDQRLIVVRCHDRRGPRRPGLWAALCIAEAIAELVEGELVDPRRAGMGLRPRVGLRPPADARVHVVDHLGVPCSSMQGRQGRQRWLTTLGMAHFGLPDLEVEAVPGTMTEIAGRLLLGVAQHLVDGTAAAPRAGAGPREVLLTLGEMHWALGRDPQAMPLHQGRGWTRIGLAREASRGWPELIRLQAPIGSRRPATSHWLTAAWLDLVGGPVPRTQRKATTTEENL